MALGTLITWPRLDRSSLLWCRGEKSTCSAMSACVRAARWSLALKLFGEAPWMAPTHPKPGART